MKKENYNRRSNEIRSKIRETQKPNSVCYDALLGFYLCRSRRHKCYDNIYNKLKIMIT